MPAFKVTRKAQADLIAIGRFTLKEWGTLQRNNYLLQLDHCFSQLSQHPPIGSACHFIAAAYRKFPQGSPPIFYKRGPKGIVEIIRVLHESMDVDSKF